jgi:DNA-directed RNA polymerase specialized sigma24 family protein
MSTSMPSAEPAPKAVPASDPLGDPETRRFLVELVRKRVPPADVEDVVQTVLLEALASEGRPTDPTEIRRWLTGVARHKAADVHRRAGREPVAEPVDQEALPPPLEARALATWAEEQAASVRDAGETLRWMAREGEGEKLETIASEENVPAARVRQRVSRMRRWMKERWLAELALVATLAIAALVAWWLLRAPHATPEIAVPEVPTVAPTPDPTPLDRARQLRADALQRCDKSDWRGCLDELDQAAGFDPTGDGDPAVTTARERAKAALEANPPLPESKGPPKTKMMKAPPEPAPTAAPNAPPKAAPTSDVPPTKAMPKSVKPSPTPIQMQKQAPSFDLDGVDGSSTGNAAPSSGFEGKGSFRKKSDGTGKKRAAMKPE